MKDENNQVLKSKTKEDNITSLLSRIKLKNQGGVLFIRGDKEVFLPSDTMNVIIKIVCNQINTDTEFDEFINNIRDL